MRTFVIRSWANRFSGKWVVIRDDDRIVYEDHSLYGCLRWVNVWGSTLGQNKRGMALVP